MIRKLGFYFVFIVLAACDGEQQLTNVEAGTRDQILYVNNGAEPEDIDPHITTGQQEAYIQWSLFEGLVAKDPITLEPVPGMAESWEVSDDLTHYTFHLRDDALWSNGDPLTAQDFVYSWNRSLAPGLASEYAYMLYVVKNAAAYNRGEITDFSMVGVKALDNTTLEVTLEAPTPWFLQLLDHNSAYPVHRKTIESRGKFDQRGTGWTRPEYFTGNGPFHLKEWIPNKVLIIEKNPYYWDAENVRLNEIHFYPIDNKQTEERMFRTGQIHMTLDGRILTDKIEVYVREQPDHIRISPYLGIYYYLFNTTRPPFDDVRVRLAFSMAIDRQSVTDNVVKGGRSPAFAFTPPDTAGYTPEPYIQYDQEQAKKLLAEAGYPDGADFPPVELLYNNGSGHQALATALQQMWKSVLNVDVTLVNQEWLVYLNSRSNGDFDIARAGWLADYADPNNFLNLFVTGGGNNHTGWANAEYDNLIDQTNQTIDMQQRYELFQRAETILLQHSPIVPVYYEASVNLVNPDVKEFHNNVLTYYPFKHVYLSEDE